MEKHAAEVLRDALHLTAEAQAALVDSLIESLDPTIDEGAEDAWRHEIAARILRLSHPNQLSPRESAPISCITEKRQRTKDGRILPVEISAGNLE